MRSTDTPPPLREVLAEFAQDHASRLRPDQYQLDEAVARILASAEIAALQEQAADIGWAVALGAERDENERLRERVAALEAGLRKIANQWSADVELPSAKAVRDLARALLAAASDSASE